LWKSGYSTAMLGDWPRNDHPLDHGFEYWCGFDRASPPAPFPTQLAVGRGRMELPANRDGMTGVTWQELLTIETRQWLRALGSSNRPGWLLVRLPMVVPEPTTPDSSLTVPGATWSAWNEYFANVQHALAETKLEDRVSVIVTALAGEAARKDGLSERELRVPFVITGAGVRDPGRSLETPVATWDLPATWADLAGIAASSDGQDGVSLRPWLTGTGTTEPRLFYWRAPEHPEDQAVRRVQWKGIYTGKTRSLRLYDLASDPRETENVAGRHPDVVRSLLKGAPEAIEATVRRLDQSPRK
jgi:arylsulfatase A-like enzyme